MTKRSYRSESELAKSVKHHANSESGIVKSASKHPSNSKANRNTYESQPTDRFSSGTLSSNININTNNGGTRIASSNSSGPKLNKSVNSLLHAPNQSLEYNVLRIEELNHACVVSGVYSNQHSIQQQQTQRVKNMPVKSQNASNVNSNSNSKWYF